MYRLTLCHGLVAQDELIWTHLCSVSLFHYIDDIMLSSDCLTDLEPTMYNLKGDLLAWNWVINKYKV